MLYAVIMSLTASSLFPDNLEDYGGYRDYLYWRRAWVFGLLGLARLTDVADSLVKDIDYWIAVGIEYHVSSVVGPSLYIVAIFSRNPRFHGAFAPLMLVHQASWAVGQYWTVG